MTLAPSIFSLPHLSHPTNSHLTATLDEQFETEALISEVLKLIDTSDTSDDPDTSTITEQPELGPLTKGDHVKYICSTMNYLPAPYVSLDASRPWLLFWTTHSLDLLGCALDDETKKRYVNRVRQG
jgi:protein farnesyltransferase subunit beta